MALVSFLLNIDGYEDCLAHILKNPFVELIHMISRGAVWDLILLQGVNGDTVSGKPVMEGSHLHTSCLT